MIIEIKDIPKNVKRISIDRIVIEMQDGSTSSVGNFSGQNSVGNKSDNIENIENDELTLSGAQDVQDVQEAQDVTVKNEPIPDEMLDLTF